jgi:hypothetical protein
MFLKNRLKDRVLISTSAMIDRQSLTTEDDRLYKILCAKNHSVVIHIFFSSSHCLSFWYFVHEDRRQNNLILVSIHVLEKLHVYLSQFCISSIHLSDFLFCGIRHRSILSVKDIVRDISYLCGSKVLTCHYVVKHEWGIVYYFIKNNFSC